MKLKINLVLFSLIIGGLYGCKTLSQKEAQKPNIIFILTDDQRWDALGFAGNSIIHTPEMDKLAETGTYFENAMVTTPICAASRASLLSGLHERTHNFNFSTGDVRKEYMQKAYPVVLRENGYHTGFFGKLGVKYAEKDSLFNEIEDYDRANKPDKESYFYKTIGADTVHLTRYTGQKGLDFIENAPTDQPFSLSLSFSAPHAADGAKDQYFWQQETDHLYQDITIPDPQIADDKYFNALPKKVQEGFNRLRWTWRYDTPEKYQHSVKGYYRMISGIDLEIGKIRAKLKEKGIDKNTIIIMMGDNGYFLGERQLAGKWLMYDNSLRVPMIINDPRKDGHNRISDMVLNIDVPATMLDLAGVEKPASWQGKSLVPYVNKEIPTMNRDTVLVEHLWEFASIPPSEGVRTKNLKYFRYRNEREIEELYDLNNDPLEINNLAANPEWASAKTDLRNKLESLGESYSDQFSKGPKKIAIETNGTKPSFMWDIPETAKAQKAYQILVASSLENLKLNKGDLWDSGETMSVTNRASYEGKKLNATDQYYWKVRIWDATNYTTNYSQPIELSLN